MLQEKALKINTIKKELEVLEILKSHLHREVDYYDNGYEDAQRFECICVDDLGGINLTDDEIDIIKEWLER